MFTGDSEGELSYFPMYILCVWLCTKPMIEYELIKSIEFVFYLFRKCSEMGTNAIESNYVFK